MQFEKIIKTILADFTVAWNQWDFDALENFLATEVKIYSPKIFEIYPENTSCILEGKENIINYWKLYQHKIGSIKVNQLSFEKKGRVVKTINQVIGQPIIIQEKLILNEYGKIVKLKYEYQPIE